MPEVQRPLLTLAESPNRFNFRLAWSTFRRPHQAIAKGGHNARRVRSHPPPLTSTTIPTPAQPLPELTDARWLRIAALLPLGPTRGRPAQDHRRLLAGILWVMRTGATWREILDRFGPWHTVYTRYRDWNRVGLWPQILTILMLQDPLSAS